MSTSDIAIDTNAAVALMGGDPVITQRIGAGSKLYMSVIVLGELYFGAEKSARVAANLARIEQLRARVALVDCTAPTAREFGRIHQRLRSQGTPIPENDMWIAAAALEHGLALVTRDAHFQHVVGLQVVSW